jgi:MoaA/NifB/PqqE/SkfB family radical SAM enzyme
MQISIDNVNPDDVSKKSLKTLDPRLKWLAEHADFHVNINSVVGGGIHKPHDAIVVARRAVELGFTSTVGIIHDSDGQLQPLSEQEQSIYRQVRDMGKKNYARLNYFQENIAHGVENKWKCRAGARYLYICEDGLVHYCSQQRGYPAKPLAQYTRDDIRREFITEKGCAPRCTVACVHYTSYMDFWRAPQTIPAPPAASQNNERLIQLQHH